MNINGTIVENIGYIRVRGTADPYQILLEIFPGQSGSFENGAVMCEVAAPLSEVERIKRLAPHLIANCILSRPAPYFHTSPVERRRQAQGGQNAKSARSP